MKELMEFVKELSFVRVGGSAEEKKAAELVMEEINQAVKEAGREDIQREYMPFKIPSAKVGKCSVQAAGRKIPCVPLLRSGNIDRECELVYLDEAYEEDVYKRLAEHKASAFLVMQGRYYHSEQEASLFPRRLGEHLSRNGVIPGFAITAADALWLIQEEVEKVHLTLNQEDVELESGNVSAVIEGTDLKEESIILTAHYDSVPVGAGSWDNATGTAALLAIFRHFAANQPRRTLRFLWCGSEELGLLGSKAYVEQQEELLDKTGEKMNLSLVEMLSEKSLYKRRKSRKDFVSQLEADVETPDLDKDDVLRLNRIQVRYSKEQIEEFIESHMTDEVMDASKLVIRDGEDFEKLILAYDYSTRKNSRYAVLEEDAVLVEQNGYRYPALRFVRRGV